VQFENKDPRGFAEFKALLAEHDPVGAALTQLGVQRERPSLWDLTEEMKGLAAPTLILTGDEDWPCLLPKHKTSSPRKPARISAPLSSK
jgi:hypothetical protein